MADAALQPLATKLHPAAIRRRHVLRPRLLAALSTDPLPRVTLVDAPPGWGKTTLVAEWMERDAASHRFAWLALDRDDNDPARFWTYVVEALRTAEPELGAAILPSLRVPGARLLEVVLPRLINELDGLSRPVVLVLDDYHVIANRDIHDGMAFVVEHMPLTLRLVLISRSDPPLPLPRLRARAELTEVRAQELRFSEEETTELLNNVLELDLGADQVAQLQGRTEGWAVGLYLVALSLRGRPDAAGFIAAFAGNDRHVVDYLVSEVLGSLSDDLRTFLLRTSVLDRFCAPLCDTVAGVEDSVDVLAEVERSNLFLVPLDAKRRWYRYHHLFAELLRHELEQAEPELVSVLHRRASTWLRDEGEISAAVHHATLAGDFGVVADLVALNWSAFLQRGQLELVAGWLDTLPDEVVADDPRLCLTRAWIAVNAGRIDEVDHWIEAADRSVRRGSVGEDDISFEAAAGMLRCIHEYLEGDVGAAIEAARSARALEPSEDSPWRSVGCPVLGIALFWRGERAASAETLRKAVQRARPAGNHLAVIHAHSCLAASHVERSEWETADQLARTAIDLGRERGLDEHWANAMAHIARGRVLESRGELAEAEAEIRHGVELSRRGVAKAELGYALLSDAQLQHDRGRYEEARALAREARRAIESCPDPGVLTEQLSRTERRLRVGTSTRSAGIEELTERELAVLRLLRSELSLREIGSELYVSLNTVKTHSKGIYRKLGASSREEALERARELGLV
jgi:LuxR family transcriptional regulator, maltose regulon positive regulatory protein